MVHGKPCHLPFKSISNVCTMDDATQYLKQISPKQNSVKWVVHLSSPDCKIWTAQDPIRMLHFHHGPASHIIKWNIYRHLCFCFCLFVCFFFFFTRVHDITTKKASQLSTRKGQAMDIREPLPTIHKKYSGSFFETSGVSPPILPTEDFNWKCFVCLFSITLEK